MAQIVSRRSFLRTSALGSAGLFLTSRLNAQSVGVARKPNLLVFLPDQQRPDTIGCYGGDPAIAPNLNALASQSFVFQNTYVTHPLCTPSRSSLLTGTWPHANGCTHNSVPLDHRLLCLPELIDDHDYRFAYMRMYPAPPPRNPLNNPPTNDTMRIIQSEIDFTPEVGSDTIGHNLRR